MSQFAIRVEGVSKRYRVGGPRQPYQLLRDRLARIGRVPFNGGRCQAADGAPQGTFLALDAVTFEVAVGEVVGVIGRNGAGKSTLLKLLSRITQPTAGKIDLWGRVGSLLEVGTGFHPELTGIENIYLNGAILGMPQAEIRRKLDEIVAFAEVERFADTPVKHYSSGMYLRLAFAVAAHLEPDILLVDEVLAVGDVAFQNKCLGKMNAVARDGRTVLFVSHNMAAVRSLCSRALLLQAGQICTTGDVAKSIETYYREIGALASGENCPAGGRDEARAGFGPIRINDGLDNSIAQSDGFLVSTLLRMPVGADSFWLFLCIEDMHGRTLVHLREESASLAGVRAGAGGYSISVAIPPLWLNPGLYSVYFKVLINGNRAAPRFTSDRFPLDVSGNSSVVDAVLHPRAGWAVSSADATVTP